MRIFLFTIVFLMPLAMPAQTDTIMQKNNIEVLKAEAARKAAEAKAAAEKAQRAAEEALEAARQRRDGRFLQRHQLKRRKAKLHQPKK